MTSNSCAALTVAFLLGAAFWSCADECRVLATDRDFETLAAFPAKPLTSWQWSDEEKGRAADFSRMELVRTAEGALRWTLRVEPGLPFKRPYLEVLNLGVSYFPPEADAIRMTVRAVSGRMAITWGGPTAYFGNSDVFMRPVILDAGADGTEWRTIEFSLHHGLWRNFRRASFSEGAPWIYYARWAQEPTFFYLLEGSQGELEISKLELVARGESKPFPAFAADALSPVATLAEFQSPGASTRMFSALVGQRDEEFAFSWNQQGKVHHPPVNLSVESDPAAGPMLCARGQFLEEVSAAGIHLAAAPAGDGLQIHLKVDAPIPGRVAPSVNVQPVDFLLYVTPDPASFPWGDFGPGADLMAGPGRGFDCNLTHEKLKRTEGVSLAVYHARRWVPGGVWGDVVIPVEDFLCLYGCGDFAPLFREQRRLDSTKLVAAALLAPWPRRGRFETTLSVRDITLVRFKEPPASRISYLQTTPGASIVKSPKGRYAACLLPGETALPAALQVLLERMDPPSAP